MTISLRSLGKVLLGTATLLLCGLGLWVVIGLRIDSFSDLPEPNRRLVEALERMPSGSERRWPEVAEPAETVCLLPFEAEPRALLASLLRRPIEVPAEEIGRLRETHWSIARISSDRANLLAIPLSRLRLRPDEPRCQPFGTGRFRVVDDGDKRYVEPLGPP